MNQDLLRALVVVVATTIAAHAKADHADDHIFPDLAANHEMLPSEAISGLARAVEGKSEAAANGGGTSPAIEEARSKIAEAVDVLPLINQIPEMPNAPAAPSAPRPTPSLGEPVPLGPPMLSGAPLDLVDEALRSVERGDRLDKYLRTLGAANKPARVGAYWVGAVRLNGKPWLIAVDASFDLSVVAPLFAGKKVELKSFLQAGKVSVAAVGSKNVKGEVFLGGDRGIGARGFVFGHLHRSGANTLDASFEVLAAPNDLEASASVSFARDSVHKFGPVKVKRFRIATSIHAGITVDTVLIELVGTANGNALDYDFNVGLASGVSVVTGKLQLSGKIMVDVYGGVSVGLLGSVATGESGGVFVLMEKKFDTGSSMAKPASGLRAR